jgi:hypothetical protein
MSQENHDQLCARFGYQIATDLYALIPRATENHITKSLGVLQENGVYAFALYQASRGNERGGAEKLARLASYLLSEAHLKPFDGNSTISLLEGLRGDQQKRVTGLADNLDSLLLAKRLLEQALIYARYHTKALANGEENK